MEEAMNELVPPEAAGANRKLRWGIGAAMVLGLLSLIAALSSPVMGGTALVVTAVFLVGIWKRVKWAYWGLALYYGLRVGGALMMGATVALPTMGEIAWGGAFFGGLIWLLVRAGGALGGPGEQGWRYGVWGLSAVMVVWMVSTRIYSVPTRSMEPTILVGDRIVFQTLGVGRPERGEIYAYRPKTMPGQVLVKRVVGVPGDRLRMVEGQLMVNGQRVDEPYKVLSGAGVPEVRNFPLAEAAMFVKPEVRESFARATVNGELVLPSEQYFVLGDNRDFALDSRYTGFVGREDFVGRARVVCESLEPGIVRWGRTFLWL